MKEKYKEHCDKIKARAAEHYGNNREQKLEYQKNYAIEHKEIIKHYKKDYHEKRKIEKAQRDKEYREMYNDRIKEHKNAKFECPCGGNYTKSNESRHLHTTKHKSWLAEHNKG